MTRLTPHPEQQEIARLLLDSARSDAPSPESLPRAAALLGATLPPAALASTTSAAASQGAASTTSVASKAASTAQAATTVAAGATSSTGVSLLPLVSSSTLKVLALCVGVGGGAWGAVQQLQPESPASSGVEHRNESRAKAPATSESHARKRSFREEQVRAREIGSTALPNSSPTRNRPQGVPAAGAKPTKSKKTHAPASRTPEEKPRQAIPASALRNELEQLAVVRAHLLEGRGTSALSALRIYRDSFADGVLGVEAEALRVEALFHAKGRTVAERAALEFAARFPGNIHLERFVQMDLLPRQDPNETNHETPR